MVGQAIDLSKEPRKPTPQEMAIWKWFIESFNKFSVNYRAYLSTANVADAFQRWSNDHGVPFVVYDQIDQAAWNAIANRFNIMGRLINGCLQQKYFAHFSNGDVTILAPKTMDSEQYKNDIYPQTREESLKGILVLAIVAGVALLVGGVATLTVVDWDTQVRDKRFRDKILKADREMIKKPKALRDEWAKMKNDSRDLIYKSNAQHEGSWLGDLFEGATGKAAGIGLLLIGLAIVWGFAKKKG